VAAIEVKSYCRICPAYCGVVVTVEGDRVLSVKGDRDHPVSGGYTCPKGRALGELHHHAKRLDGPLMRKHGRLEPVSWDELLDDLAEKIGATLKRTGPSGIGMYFGTHANFDSNLYWAGSKLLRALGARGKYTSGTIDAPSYPVVRRLMSGVGWLFTIPDFECTKLLLLLGTNPVVSHNSHMAGWPNPTARLREITRRGGEIWVVDARETETTQLATGHLAPHPGSDYAVLGYLLRELLRDGADRAYLDRHAIGVDELTRAVERFDLDTSARLAGVPAAQLEELLAAVRRHGRISLLTGTGVSMAPAANTVHWFALALLAVTGSMEREGGVWFNPGFMQSLDRRDGKPDPGPEPGPASRPELPRQGGEYPTITLVDELEAGNLDSLFVLGGNLIVALPDEARVRAALARASVVVVSDVVDGDMVECATHVLASTDPLERADLPHFADCLSPAVAAQYTPAVVPVGADRKPGWWPLAAVAERLGIPILPDGVSLDEADDDTFLRARVRPTTRATFEELKSAGTALVDPERPFGWVERNILPDGRWNLAPEPLVAQLDEIAEVPQLALIPRRLWRRMNSYGRELAETQEREPPDVLLNPEDAAVAGVADGEGVRVESANGSLSGVARVDGSIRRGAVAIPHGWTAPNVSVLLSGTDDVDPLTGMPTYCAVPVSLSAA